MKKKPISKMMERVLSLNFAYLDKAVKELNAMDLKNADKFSDTEKQKFNLLHTAIAVGLDITHRSYPECYDLFPENKENLDNAFAMFKRFEKAKLLNECPCQYCKDTPDPNPANTDSDAQVETESKVTD